MPIVVESRDSTQLSKLTYQKRAQMRKDEKTKRLEDEERFEKNDQ